MSTVGTTEQESVAAAEISTLTLAHVLAWEPATLTARGDAWSSQAQKLTAFDDTQYRAVDAGRDFWTGSAADAMRTKHEEIRTTTRTFATALQDGAAAAHSGASTLDAAKIAVVNAVKSAESSGYEVGDDGTVDISTSTHQTLLSQLPDASSYSVAAGSLQVGADASTTAVKAALENARTAAATVQSAIENAFANLPEGNSGLSYGLPQNTGGYGSYTKEYPFTAPAGYSAAEIHAEIAKNFDKYFPFSGCGPSVETGKVCSLDSPVGGQPVLIEYAGPDGIVIKSLDGHVEGSGRTITFQALPTTGNLWELKVDAWGPVGGASVIPGGAETSGTVWQRFANNLTNGLPPSPGPMTA
ncbi:hypothetical protein ACWF99_08800 [Nocardia sp. NPDC055002]|uniref:hypothetical protein n=1 Tax=Nocardia sp. NPDC056952 TaxID=3345979 RepID=UPI003631F805